MENSLFKQLSIEEKICFKIQNGDETFVDDIKNEYACGPDGYEVVIKNILWDPHDADECAGDVLSALWEHFKKNPQPPGDIRSYVKKAARNMAYKRYNDNKKKDIYQIPEPTPSDFDLESIVMTKELADEIGKYIHNIPDRLDRKILIYKWYVKMSTKEIAGIVGVNYNTVNTKINRYKKKIAEHLIERGFINENNFRKKQ